MESFKKFFKYTFDFQGVSDRKDFWLPILCVVLCEIVFWALALLGTAFQVMALLITLFFLVPTISLTVRRLHDTDRGAINLLWLLVPLVGIVIILIFASEKTKYFVK